MARYLTPLRYPGGKQKLFPFIKEIIEQNCSSEIEYLEPYSGGAGIAIELLLKGIVKKIHLNDLSKPVFSFWHSIVSNPEWLCKEISIASLSVDEWKRQREIFRNADNVSIDELAFATLYLNRCNRSGILNAGIIGGLNQNGNWKLDARFSRKEIIQRIETISNMANKITVSNLDAEKLIDSLDKKIHPYFIYFDPPYMNKAERLYLNYYTADDHIRLSEKIQNIKKMHWVVSYDYNEQIIKYYRKRRMFSYNLQYNALRAYKGKELFIFSDNLNIPNSSRLNNINEALIYFNINNHLTTAST